MLVLILTQDSSVGAGGASPGHLLSQDTLHKAVCIIARCPHGARQVHRLSWKVVAWVTKFPSKS